MFELLQEMVGARTTVLVGLIIDIIGFSILGFDAIRTQSQLAKSIKDSEEIANKIAGHIGAIPVFDNFTQSNELRDPWAIFPQCSGRELSERRYEITKKQVSALAEYTGSLMKGHLQILKELHLDAQLQQKRDRQLARLSAVNSRVGVIVVLLGFAVQIIGTFPKTIL